MYVGTFPSFCYILGHFIMLLLWLFYLVWEVLFFLFNLGKSYFKTTESAMGLVLSDLESYCFLSCLKSWNPDSTILEPFLTEFNVTETFVVAHYIFCPKFLTLSILINNSAELNRVELILKSNLSLHT